jgi:hypothetical protein
LNAFDLYLTPTPEMMTIQLLIAVAPALFVIFGNRVRMKAACLSSRCRGYITSYLVAYHAKASIQLCLQAILLRMSENHHREKN